jgi:nucleoside-diphosphate-sugar epimerase
MRIALQAVKWRDVIPRMIADFVVIHCAMLIAFAVSMAYQTRTDEWPSTPILTNTFRHYYFLKFLILSTLFPVVFFLKGLYTYVRFYPTAAKLERITVVVLFSLTVFLTINYLVIPRANPIGRSVSLTFAGVALLGLVGIRAGKEWLNGNERNEQKRRSEIPEQGVVLVIGGAGYIGCCLVRRLLETGKRVRILDNAVYGVESIQDLLNHPNLDYVYGDSRNIQDVVKAMRQVSSIVHLAAIVGDPACELDRKTTIEINYAATRMLIEVAKGSGVERFLFASSCSVYGATDEFMDENSKIQPVSLYGETKVSSEQVLRESATNSFRPVIMRFATVFGLSSRPRFDLVVNLLAAKAKQDGRITVFNGQQWRPFIHVKDLAEAILLLLNAPLSAVSREIFNVGDNRLNLTLSEVAEVIQRVFPHARIEHHENSDRRNYRVDFSKIEKRLGFRCQYTVEDGVREIEAAFDANKIEDYRDIRFSNLGFLRETGTPENKSEFDAAVMAAFGGEQIHRVAAGEMQPQYFQVKAAAAH